MKYYEIEPAPHQSPFVESLWYFHAGDLKEEAPTHVIVPDGAVSLSYILFPNGQTFVGLTGPSIKAHKTTLTPGAIYAGVRIRPGAGGSVLGANVSDYRDKFGRQIQPQPEIVKLMQAQIPDHLSETALVPLLRAATDIIAENAGAFDEPVCQFANSIMQSGGNANLGELSNSLGVGPRQLRRRFKYQCGLTPKEFSRLRRIRSACIDLIAREDWPLASTAARSGFSDQAHMTREFTEMFGNSATFVEEYLKQISHGALVESAR